MKLPRLKRILTLLLAVAMTATVLGIPVFAEGDEPEYQQTDSYVINYDGVDYGDYEAQEPFLYSSPHRSSLTTATSNNFSPSTPIFNLINTTKLGQSGTGAYASIAAYCTDVNTYTQKNVNYRRINLEDSTYFDDDAAGRLRAIFLHSFPYITDLSAIEAVVNNWLEQNSSELDKISGLTGAEVITATQYSIWLVANSDDVSGNAAYTKTENVSLNDLSNVVYPKSDSVDGTEGARSTTKNNITALSAYLLDLEPMAPQQLAVSESSFVSQSMSAVMQENGKYTLTIHAEVKTSVSDGDDLVLTAIAGSKTVSVRLVSGQRNYTLTLTDVDTLEPVKLEINGTQAVSDVFLFDANGGRNQAQTMIGYDGSALPVHAEATVEAAEQSRTLTFYKTTVIQNDDCTETRIPLENIIFDIYRVADLDAFTSGKVILPKNPTAEDAQENYDLAGTVSTGADGKAVWDLNAAGQADGVFLVVERENPAIVDPADPFYVCVPMTNSTGDGWVYDVVIEPKNDVVGPPDIHKDVTEIDNDEDTFDVGEVHTWIIRAEIPADIAQGKVYRIEDDLDYRLTFRGNIRVAVAGVTDPAQTYAALLTLNTDYTLTASQATDSEDHTIDSFSVELTPAGMEKLAATVGTGDFEDFEVRVFFDAIINSNAILGEDIPNQATLDYTNSVGFVYHSVSDEPVVYTGGVSILKYDAEDPTKTLAGAVFQVARRAAQDEIDAGIARKLTIDGRETYVVFIEFYTDAAMTVKADSVTTGEDGTALIYGLAYGDYYLVETKAPDGYNLLSQPLPVTIGETSHLEASAIRVANSSKLILPPTGGIGTVAFTVAGLVLVGAAAALVVCRKKESR
ncbi:MAG: SpaH/EbpB family LPXTG-anchored major pilin [Faecousia sp.]